LHCVDTTRSFTCPSQISLIEIDIYTQLHRQKSCLHFNVEQRAAKIFTPVIMNNLMTAAAFILEQVSELIHEAATTD
jgi:hypothetical protein